MLNNKYIIADKYEVIKLLQLGNMEKVCLCKDIDENKLMIIKKVKRAINENIDILSQINILHEISHTSSSNVVDIFYADDNFYIVENYIEGETLEAYVKNKLFLQPEEIYSITVGICDAICNMYGFNSSIVYRELKPSDIIIDSKGKVTLIDGHISKVQKNNDRLLYRSVSGKDIEKQQLLHEISRQKEMYSIGMLMYFMATGRIPLTVLQPLMDDSYTNEVDDNLKEIIKKCFKNQLENKFDSVEELKRKIILEFFNNNKCKKPIEISSSNTTSKAYRESKKMKKAESECKKRTVSFTKAREAIISFFSYLIPKIG